MMRHAKFDQAFGLRLAAIAVRLSVLIVFCLTLTACHRPDSFTTGDGSISPITAADIRYSELARRYNQSVEPFGTLWSRTAIDIEWYEIEQGGDRNYRSESGEGKFILRRPTDTALTVEKLGKTYLWAGSDRERYWLFDLVDSDNKVAYVGAFAKLGESSRRSFPLPVRPDVVPMLLGLMPLPTPEALGIEPPVDLYNNQYLVELPGMRLLIDRTTYRPTRVDLTDTQGFSMLTSKLEGAFVVEVEGQSERDWPTMCQKAAVYVAGYESRLTVSIESATTDPARVRDAMFQFEALHKALKPQTVEQLDGQ